MTKSATQRAKEPEYKDNVYVDGAKLFCHSCKEVLDHEKKVHLTIILNLKNIKKMCEMAITIYKGL